MESAAVWLWGVVTIGGPLLLGAIVAYGIWRNRRRRKRLASQGTPQGAGETSR